MYIFLTTRCNMLCAHCLHSCTAEGEDMNMATFRNCLKLAGDCCSPITLGGGEPTLHPRFEQMLLEAMAVDYNGEECVPFVATNGSHRRRALMLASLARQGMISARLSLDRFHDRSMVHEEVVEAFTWRRRPGEGSQDYRRREPKDFRDINDGSGRLSNGGRCDFGTDEEYCVCPGREVQPNGDIYVCGCRPGRLLGNVNRDSDLAGLWPDCDCVKEVEKEELELREPSFPELKERAS